MEKHKKRVTIKDVAEHANVSIGTVSRAINDSGYVGKEARKKIVDAIKNLNYIPNTTARSMVNKKSAIVGVAVPEINNPYLAELVVRIEASLSKKNYSIMLCNTQYKYHKIANFVDDLVMRNAEGVIFIATDIIDENILKKLKNYLYTVSIGQHISDFDSIVFDDYKTAYELTEHLINIGHRRIAMIGFNQNASQTMERVRGFRAAMQKHDVNVSPDYLISSEGGENSGYYAAKKLLSLKLPPTAIMAINDFYAVHTYAAITESGKNVGSDISVVGFDDILMARLIHPALTTVRYDTQAIADLSTSILHEKIITKTDMNREIVLSCNVVLRESARQLNKE